MGDGQICHLQAKHTLYSDVFHVFKRESDNAGCSAALTSMYTESQSVTYRERDWRQRETGRKGEER